MKIKHEQMPAQIVDAVMQERTDGLIRHITEALRSMVDEIDSWVDKTLLELGVESVFLTLKLCYPRSSIDPRVCRELEFYRGCVIPRPQWGTTTWEYVIPASRNIYIPLTGQEIVLWSLPEKEIIQAGIPLQHDDISAWSIREHKNKRLVKYVVERNKKIMAKYVHAKQTRSLG